MKFKELEKTCFACPTQWEGVTVNNNNVYFRFRHGRCRVDFNGETIFSKYADGDGVMGDEDVLELLDWLPEPGIEKNYSPSERWFMKGDLIE